MSALGPAGLRSGLAARARALTRTQIAFATLLALATALRVYAMVSYWPAVITNQDHDGAAYVRSAHYGLAADTQDPSGYPLFLRVLHALSHQLAFTIAVQHLLGLVAGALLFATVRRIGGPSWLGLVPAAVVWFNGDGLFLEHALLSEALFVFLLTATLYAAVRAAQADGWAWGAVAGALAAASLSVRAIALLLPVGVVVWLAFVLWRTHRGGRGARAWMPQVVAAAVAALLVTGAYTAARHHATGHWTPAVEGSGWDLYARVAEFADCRDFTPPAGTAALCERSAPSTRPGPGYYHWDGGPAIATFGEPPSHDGQLAAFARAAILHQPGAYLQAAGADLIRYVDATAGAQRVGGYPGPDTVAFHQGPIPLDAATLTQVHAYYSPFRSPGTSPGRGLAGYQGDVRVSGTMLLALLTLALVSLPLAVPQIRRAQLLLLGVALYLLLVPALTGGASWRYVIPAEGPIAASAALGAWAIVALAGARLGLAERLRAGPAR